MPILHKFQNHNFKNGFQTYHSILSEVPFKPKAIFIGTFNHGWSWNDSDFFYGRGGYMWPIMANLFLYKQNKLMRKRTARYKNPSIQEIYSICKIGKFIFADIVKGIKDEIESEEIMNENCVLVDRDYRWESRLINDSVIGQYSDVHLENLAKRDLLDDNVQEIINYINKTQSIEHIYFTFKSGNWLIDKMNEIKEGIRNDVSSCSIFTPTGNGFGYSLEPPFNNRILSLTHCWVWNGLSHEIPIHREGYGHLDHEWLREAGSNPNEF